MIDKKDRMIEELMNAIKVIQNNSIILLLKINDMLDYSSTENDKIQLHPSKFNVLEIIESVK